VDADLLVANGFEVVDLGADAIAAVNLAKLLLDAPA
jgi:methanogenic corrinoid protein MtbC1